MQTYERRQWFRRRHYEEAPERLIPRLIFHFHRKRRKITNRMIKRHLQHRQIGEPITFAARILLAYIGKISREYCLSPMVSYGSKAAARFPITDGAQCIVAAPIQPGNPAKLTARFCEPTEAHLLVDAVATACSSALVTSNSICLPGYYLTNRRANVWDDRFFFWQDQNDIGLIHKLPREYHPAGLMLFGAGAYNWYHWLIDALPAAYLAERLSTDFAEYPLVIPHEIAQQATFRESLELFRNDREIITIHKGLHQFGKLLTVDGIVREPMNMLPGYYPSPEDYAFNGNCLRAYRDTILARLQIEPNRYGDRIFLARKSKNRNYNSNEIVEISKKYGFQTIYPEHMSFREQVESFSRAAFVIGPSGAAFANTLFCQPGTRLLSWVIPQHKGFCSFTNIAQTVGAELRYLFATPDRPVKSTFDAFFAGYRIDSVEFEAALRNALYSENY